MPKFVSKPYVGDDELWHEGNDGPSSGLDADLLGGASSSAEATANTIPVRDADGNIDGVITDLGGMAGVALGALLERPEAGVANRLYVSTTDNIIYRDTGVAWVSMSDEGGSHANIEYLATIDQHLATTSEVAFAGLSVDGTSEFVGDISIGSSAVRIELLTVNNGLSDIIFSVDRVNNTIGVGTAGGDGTLHVYGDGTLPSLVADANGSEDIQQWRDGALAAQTWVSSLGALHTLHNITIGDGTTTASPTVKFASAGTQGWQAWDDAAEAFTFKDQLGAFVDGVMAGLRVVGGAVELSAAADGNAMALSFASNAAWLAPTWETDAVSFNIGSDATVDNSIEFKYDNGDLTIGQSSKTLEAWTHDSTRLLVGGSEHLSVDTVGALKTTAADANSTWCARDIGGAGTNGRWVRLVNLSAVDGQFMGSVTVQGDYSAGATSQYRADFSFGAAGDQLPILNESGDRSEALWKVFVDNGVPCVFFFQPGDSLCAQFTYTLYHGTDVWTAGAPGGGLALSWTSDDDPRALQRVDVDTTNFTGNLSATDTTVQLALETLDAMTPSGDTLTNVDLLFSPDIDSEECPTNSVGLLLEPITDSDPVVLQVGKWGYTSQSYIFVTRYDTENSHSFALRPKTGGGVEWADTPESVSWTELGGSGGDTTAVTAKTDTYNVLVGDLGASIGTKVLTMNAASSKTFNLPSVAAGDIGKSITFVKLGAGTLVIDAADSDVIADSGAGDTIYNDQAAETYATITLLLATETQWVIVGAHGTWVTTD